MDDTVRARLDAGGICDITTIGARSGDPHRVELYFHALDGEFFITGRPSERTRDWLANMRANPGFTLHLKDGVTADLPAIATEITDPSERRDALMRIRTRSWDVEHHKALETNAEWVEKAPLVRFAVEAP
jgi:hypothetical protein